jgi:hypothetical protein
MFHSSSVGSSGFVETLERRQLLSASSEIGHGPPPDAPTPAASVVFLAPSETDSGLPNITVTVDPAADKAPPTTEILVTKTVDISTPKLSD